ncbi:ABC transporter ATP-binding protein [candidate division WOR-3 bacterium]|nr:ABC transporter ATP-binding protein [candidate division WOR-3 bacterium]
MVVTSERAKKEKKFGDHGHCVSIEFLPYEYLIREIRTKRGTVVKTLVKSESVYDRSGNVRYLKKLAAETMVEGPNNISRAEARKISVRWFNARRKLSSLIAGNPSLSVLLMDRDLCPLIRNFYSLNNYWLVKDEYLLSDLKMRSPMLYRLCSDFLHEADVSKKYERFNSIIRHVLPEIDTLSDQDRHYEETRGAWLKRTSFFVNTFRFLVEFIGERLHLANIFRFVEFLKPYRTFFLVSLIFSTTSVLLSIPYPFLSRTIIDTVLPSADVALLEVILITMFGVTVLKAVWDFAGRYYGAYFDRLMEYDIRFKFFDHLLKLSHKFYDTRDPGQIMYRFTDATESVRLVTDILLQFLRGIINLIVVPVFVFIIDWRLALISSFVIPLNFSIYYLVSKLIGRYTSSVTRRMAEYTARNYETISGIKIIQAFGLETYIKRKIKKIYLEARKYGLRIEIAMAGLSSVNVIVGGLSTFMVMWYAWHQIINGELSMGDLIAYFVLAGILFSPVRTLLSLGPKIQQALVRTSRFYEYYDTGAEQAPGKNAGCDSCPEDIKGRIEFKNVYFEYEVGETVLKNINVEIEAGQKIAIIGPIGSGKSSFVNLIPRFYEPTGGMISIDGIDIKSLDRQWLRRHIGVVPQSDFLFDDTIMENIKGGKRGAEDCEVIAAARITGAHRFIESLPEGYATRIGEEGMQLSAGQRRLIALARALIRNPSILILDETTSVLDHDSEVLILSALRKATQGRTVLMITHRLPTTRIADSILVFANGEIVGSGTHDELMERSDMYKNFYAWERAA